MNRIARLKPSHLLFGVLWLLLAWSASVILLPPILPPSAYEVAPGSITGTAGYSIFRRGGGLAVRAPAESLLLACDASGRSTACLHQLSSAGLAEGQPITAGYIEMRRLWLGQRVLVSVEADGRTLLTCNRSAERLGWSEELTSKICIPVPAKAAVVINSPHRCYEVTSKTPDSTARFNRKLHSVAQRSGLVTTAEDGSGITYRWPDASLAMGTVRTTPTTTYVHVEQGDRTQLLHMAVAELWEVSQAYNVRACSTYP
jgi:hypothetical protein